MGAGVGAGVGVGVTATGGAGAATVPPSPPPHDASKAAPARHSAIAVPLFQSPGMAAPPALNTPDMHALYGTRNDELDGRRTPEPLLPRRDIGGGTTAQQELE